MTRPACSRRRSALVMVGGALIVGHMLSAQQPAVRPLSIKDALHTHSFEATAAIRVAKSGRYVAYTLTNPERVRPRDVRHDFFSATGVPLEMEGCEVWIVDTRTGVSTSVSGSTGSSWAPTWSPNGRLLAFYSDRAGLVQLWMWDASSGALRRPTDVVAHEISGLDPARWLPDGSGLVIKINAEGVPLAEAFPSTGADTARAFGDTGVTAVVYRSGPVQDTGVTRDTASGAAAPRTAIATFVSDLAIVNLASGNVRRIVRHEPVAMYDVSPTGTYVAYSTFIGSDKANQQLHYDLWIVSVATGQAHIVARHLPQEYGRNMSWSPDGGQLAYVLGSNSTLSNDPTTSGDLFVVAAQGGEPMKVTPEGHPRLDAALDKPIWSARGDRIILFNDDGIWSVSPRGGELRRIGGAAGREIRLIMQTGEEGQPWSPDSGRSLYVTTFDSVTKRVGFAKIDLNSGGARQLVEEDRTYSSLVFGFAAEGKSLYYVVESAHNAQDIWRVDADDFRHARQVTHVNRRLEGYAFGEQRLIHWRSDDGTPLSGALLLPAGYQAGRTYPLVVSVYGGSTLSDHVYEFGLRMRAEINCTVYLARCDRKRHVAACTMPS